jgi:hypothetical protein
VQADLLHDISDAGLCECQVLEGSGNAPELKRRPQQEAPSRQPTSFGGRLESYTDCSMP